MELISSGFTLSVSLISSFLPFFRYFLFLPFIFPLCSLSVTYDPISFFVCFSQHCFASVSYLTLRNEDEDLGEEYEENGLKTG